MSDLRDALQRAQEFVTLRDYFAAHAPPPKSDMTLQEHCAYRWRYADAMLAAREAKAESEVIEAWNRRAMLAAREAK